MVALKVNRIDLLEINRAIIRCLKCGCGSILDLERACSIPKRCPSCGADLGDIAEECFHRLQDAYFAAKAASDRFRVEFDIAVDD